MRSNARQVKAEKSYVIVLSILFGLFCFRVIAQLLQLYFNVPFLPPFEAWHSGALPYMILLLAQVVIILVYAWLLYRFISKKMIPSRKQGWGFMGIGLIYFLVMVVRFVVGIAGLSNHPWFHSYLPNFFHFILAGYLIVIGYYHLQETSR